MNDELVVRTRCCNAGVRLQGIPAGEMPPPPGALLHVAQSPPEEWAGHAWVCDGCGTIVGYSLDYGTIDLDAARADA